LKHEEQVSDAINALLNNEDFGYAITDEEGVVIEWNHALEKLSGWSAADMVGNTLERVMEDGLYETHKDALAKAMKLHRKGVSRLSIVKCNIPNKLGGEPIPVRVAVRVVETRHGDFYAIAHIDKLNVEKGGD
jgi:PAS domain S-box-containing protein